jgi:hypothetical protein
LIHLGSFPKNLRCSTGQNTQKFSSQNVMSFCLAGEICVDPLPEILTHQLHAQAAHLSTQQRLNHFLDVHLPQRQFHQYVVKMI